MECTSVEPGVGWRAHAEWMPRTASDAGAAAIVECVVAVVASQGVLLACLAYLR